MNANRGKIDKVKTLKDVDAPKKPSSSYFLFCAKERANVQKEMQNCNGAEVTKELGKRWAALDDKDKEVFEEAAKKDKERYEEERRSYTPSEEFIKRKAEFDAKANLPNNSVVGQSGSSHEEYFSYLLLNWRQVHLANPGYSGRQTQEEVWRVWQSQAQVEGRVEAAERKRSKAKSTKDPLAPKRPLTAFFLFAKAKRAEVLKDSPTLKNKEVTAELGRMWNQLGEEAKAAYVSESGKAWKAFREESKGKKRAAGCVEAEVVEVQENAALEANMEEENVKAAGQPLL